jgi:hypothetical protein
MNDPDPKDLPTGDLLDQIATFGANVPWPDLQDCLRWSNEIFETGRLNSTDRKAAEALLRRLQGSA